MDLRGATQYVQSNQWTVESPHLILYCQIVLVNSANMYIRWIGAACEIST